MGKKLVISFPGVRGYEIPLLYFGAKHYEDLGYEKRFICHHNLSEPSYEKILENAEKVIRTINFGEYEDVVFVAKSIGTRVACAIKEKYHISASLILFTPLQETLQYIHRGNDIVLIAAGDQDKYLDAKILSDLCEKEGISCHIEPGVGHRMEVMNDLQRNLKIISKVITKLEKNVAFLHDFAYT